MVWCALPPKSQNFDIFRKIGSPHQRLVLQEEHPRVALKSARRHHLRQPQLDLPAGLCARTQGEDHPGLVSGPLEGVHPIDVVAGLLARLEPAGLFHMGRFRGKSECKAAHQH